MRRDIASQFARVGKALASPQRVLLMDLLAQGERPVEALANASGLSVANTSQHLRVLLAAHLVANEKHGLQVFYRLAGPAVVAFLASFQQVAKVQLAEVARLAADHLDDADLEGVDWRELRRRVDAGEALLIDVRPPEEYAAGHLPGAMSLPLEDLRRRLGELPRSTAIVAYCRGPYCALAVTAVDTLRRRGFRAARLPDGPVQWLQRRMPIVVGASVPTTLVGKRRAARPASPRIIR